MISSNVHSRQKCKAGSLTLHQQTTHTTASEIIPLSPAVKLEELSCNIQNNYPIYKKYLNEAINNKRISNIAVSGNFGIGKSSILRVFENEEDPKSRWLHISMGNFRKVDNYFNEEQNQTIEERYRCQQELEKDLLRQITAECNAKDIPRSTFKLVPMQESKLDKTIKIIVPIIIFLLVGLLFITFSNIINGSIQKVLYFVLAGLTAISSGLLTLSLLPKLHFDQVAIKTEHAELYAECTQADSYIEQHCFELVYILESLALKYEKCIMVLEDMDRLDSGLCVDIFSKLREINHMVNNRLGTNNKKLVFIYVVNDALISKITMEKFFDYILPIVPLKRGKDLNTLCSSYKLQEILRSEFDNIDDTAVQAMINAICDHFTDFRIIYNVINEYRIFNEVNAMRDKIKVDNRKLDPHLFSFIIYKNVCPHEYHRICECGKLPYGWLNNLPSEQQYLDTLHTLGFLHINILKYIGC